MQTVLTIAGFDPSSGAGITADLMVFAAHGLLGTSCITALTVQSTLGAMAVHPVSAGIVAATLRCLYDDIPPNGIKIGMLANESNVIAISDYLAISNVLASKCPIVLDPVLRSSSGRELIDHEGLLAVQQRLLPAVDWVTPNLDELKILSGLDVATREDIPKACRALQQSVASKGVNRRLGVLATGGHWNPPDDFMLTPEGEEVWFAGERLETTATHGTGCAFSSAFLSRLVLGDAPRDACRSAKLYVTGAIRHGRQRGRGTNGVNQLWEIIRVKD